MAKVGVRHVFWKTWISTYWTIRSFRRWNFLSGVGVWEYIWEGRVLQNYQRPSIKRQDILYWIVNGRY